MKNASVKNGFGVGILIFAAAASPELTPEELLDNFFDPEHYKTLFPAADVFGFEKRRRKAL